MCIIKSDDDQRTYTGVDSVLSSKTVLDWDDSNDDVGTGSITAKCYKLNHFASTFEMYSVYHGSKKQAEWSNLLLHRQSVRSKHGWRTF